MFSFFGSTSKFNALAAVGKVVKALRVLPQSEVFHSAAGGQEKLQIIYANIRV